VVLVVVQGTELQRMVALLLVHKARKVTPVVTTREMTMPEAAAEQHQQDRQRRHRLQERAAQEFRTLETLTQVVAVVELILLQAMEQAEVQRAVPAEIAPLQPQAVLLTLGQGAVAQETRAVMQARVLPA
jgi:hypothetical protein